MGTLRRLLVFYIVLNFFFAAPLRFLYSFILKADYLNYLLNAIFIGLIILYKRKLIINTISKYKWIFVCFLIIIMYSSVFESYKVIGMFFYVIIPFFFFALFNEKVIEIITSSPKLVLIVFIVSTMGIVFDYYYDFPWKSLSYSVAGKDIDVARDWTDTDSVERVGGFFRASYEAATGMIILAILLLYKTRNLILTHIIFVITLICILITTTKSCVVSVGLIYIVYITGFFGYSIKKKVSLFLISILSFVGIILPLGMIPNFKIPEFNNYSFIDRLTNTWPRLLKLFESPIQYILGLGVGAIGLGQETFGNLKLANSGDNMFIYLFGNMGILAFGLFFIIFDRMKKNDSAIFIYSTVYLLSYGITANIIESPINQLILTIVLFAPIGTKFINTVHVDQIQLN